jgi:hypothetical protein
MTHSLGIIADGRLFLVDENGGKIIHSSDFGVDIERRMDRIAEKKAWKSQGGGGMFGQGDTWGQQAQISRVKPRIEAVIKGSEADKFAYLLTTEAIGAFLEYNLAEEYERRVFHKEGFFASEFDRDPATGRLVCRFGRGHEATQIALLDSDGRDAKPVTEGDALDGCPSWDRSKEDTILFHSAGLAYSRQGYINGTAPYAIEQLNLRTSKLQTVLAAEDTDYLCPRTDSEGNLYFMSRNYEGPGGPKPPIWTTIKDTLLFPFRLARSFIDFFQIFSQLVSKKPLTTAGGPKKNGPEPVHLWLYGRLLTPDKENKDDSLASADWKLNKRSPDGITTVLASHILAYDLHDDGTILASDGCNLRLIKGKSNTVLTKIPLTESVRWLACV